ncbi:MAG TPA: NAD(P)-binding domain-containing protein [Pyrinomonadaceae bacterium]|jgi:predicted dinucleotide-binding enzyme|nr:NAD(P)-binding domain-containing protein [Pyrinomonadaceae bacterium]
MKLGILGSGSVAQVLGSGFIARGHTVMLGTREPSKLGEWLTNAGDGASVGTFAEAAAFGDIIFLSVHATGLESAIDLAGRENFAGKTVIDLSNPMDFSEGPPPRFTATVGNSLGEQVQRLLPEANVVKAFNSIGVAVMTDPDFNGEKATHFIAGDSDVAKAEATTLIAEFGWDVVDVGGIDQAFFLEALASLWVNYAIKSNSWNQAFKLLRR